MALTVGELQVEISAASDQLRKDLNQDIREILRFERRAEDATDGVSNSFLNIRTAILAVGSAIAAIGLGRGLISLVRGSTEAAGAFQQFQSQLVNFLGSQREANAAVEDFTRLASQTPFAVSEIVQAGTTLGGVALGNRERLEELTQTAVNLAAVTGLALNDAAANLQRSLTAGIASADQFRERGVRRLIEAVAGIPDLTAEPLARQRELFDEVFGPDGVFGDAAQNLSLTLPGAISNVGDAFETLQASIGQAFAPATIAGAREFLVPVLENLRDIVVDNQVAIRDFAFRFIVGLVESFTTLVRAAEIAARGLSRFFELLRVGRTLFAQATLSVLQLANALGRGGLEDEVETQRQVLQSFIDELDDPNLFGEFADGVAAVREEVDALGTRFASLDISEFTEGIREATEASDELQAAIQSAAEGETLDPAAAKAAAKQRTDAEKLITAEIRNRRLEVAGEESDLRSQLFLLDERIGKLVQANNLAGGDAAGEALVNDLLRERAGLAERAALEDSEAFGAVGDLLGENVQASLADALVAVAEDDGEAFGESLADATSTLMEEGLGGVLSNLESNISSIFSALGSQVSQLVGGGAFGTGLGAAFAAGGAILQQAITQGGSEFARSRAIQSAVTDSQPLRGIVAGPSSIGIAQVDRGIQEAFRPALEEAQRQTALLRDIRDNTGGAGVGAAGVPAASEPDETAITSTSLI